MASITVRCEPNRIRKSVGAENTLLERPDRASKTMQAKPRSRSSTRSGVTARGQGIRGRTVTLKVKYADFQQSHPQPILGDPDG